MIGCYCLLSSPRYTNITVQKKRKNNPILSLTATNPKVYLDVRLAGELEGADVRPGLPGQPVRLRAPRVRVIKVPEPDKRQGQC